MFQCWNQAFQIVDFHGCSPNINSSWCVEQCGGWLIWPYYVHVSSCLKSRFYGRNTIITFSNRGLAIAALPWMLDLWSLCWTVFMETGSSRLIFSFADTCAAVVLWFFWTILLNVWQSLSVNADFHPLFLFVDVIAPWFPYANITLETLVLDTPNNVAVSVRDASVKCTPMICPLSKSDKFPIFWFFHMDCHTTQSLMLWHQHCRVQTDKNVQCCQLKFFQCMQHKFVPQFLSVSIILSTPCMFDVILTLTANSMFRCEVPVSDIKTLLSKSARQLLSICNHKISTYVV
jgi:hypothetical protein